MRFLRNPGGNLHQFDPDPQRSKGQRSVREYDTHGCHHCGKHIVIYHSVAEDTGWCFKCSQIICHQCVDLGACDPIEAKLGRWER